MFLYTLMVTVTILMTTKLQKIFISMTVLGGQHFIDSLLSTRMLFRDYILVCGSFSDGFVFHSPGGQKSKIYVGPRFAS